MEPQHWEQIGLLFEQALERPARDRAAFLADACADPAIRAEVEALLEAEAGATAFFADLAGRAGVPAPFGATMPGASPGAFEGKRIGPYRIVREIGRGGMGAVYLAERDDPQFRQRVALKLIKRGMDTDAVQQRFLRERQILARLQHPHIARLYDGGVTDAGQPYFAMEYIDGMPLTAYCDDHRLDIEARLRLFEQVGDAVHYAHRNLIVHRDLKPSNILVTEDGTVKLLDFGIAKWIDEEAAPALTWTGMRVLTPAYAAPEQVAGEPVTTAADVYALGVVLYELLTGHTPHAGTLPLKTSHIKRPSAAVAGSTTITHPDGAASVLTPEAISQARATRPERLRRRLSGDLDAICLKALRPEPEQRYDSAGVFVEDVKRHLAGLPVEAHAGAAGYRLRKFIQRNRVLVGATALVILALSAGLAAALWQARRAEAAAARAEAEAATAEQVKEYLVTVFGASDPWEQPGGAELTARELLAQGVERVGTLEREPAVQAELLDALGNVYSSLGLFDEARALLEQALAKRRALHGAEHEEVATSTVSLAGLLLDMGAYDEAEPLYREALAMRRRLLGPDHLDYAATLNDLGVLLNSRGEYGEAEPLLRASLAIQRRHHGAKAHRTVAVTLANLAGGLRDKKAYDEAEQLYREALAMQRQLLGADHPNVATSLSNLARVLREREDYEEAEALMREALAMRQRLFGDAHHLTAGTRYQLGRLLLTTGRATEAESLFRQALHVSEAVNGAQHWKTANARVSLGRTLTVLGRYAEAESYLQEAHAFYQHGDVGGSPTNPAEALEALVELYEAWGRPEAALAYTPTPMP